MIDHLPEIKNLVNSYSQIRKSMDLLEEQTKMLELRKNQIELQLAQTREAELILIDKIKQETGQEPDFYKILQTLNNESNEIHQ